MRVKALEVNRGFFLLAPPEIKAGRITVALDARRPQSVYSHLSVCLDVTRFEFIADEDKKRPSERANEC